MAFTLVSPPEYPEELQEIAKLDSDQRFKFISILANGWLAWKNSALPDLEIASDIVDIIQKDEEFSKYSRVQEWAEDMDNQYLDMLDSDIDEGVVQPFFLRARFAASLSCAKDALTNDKKLDELLYEYSFSREVGTDEVMLNTLHDVRAG